MNIPTGLLALVAALIVGVYIAQPFFSKQVGESGSRAGRGTAAQLRLRAELLQRRNEIYAAIRDLDFDYKTNKVSEESYTAERYALVAQGVEVLQQLDTLPVLDESDPLEAAIAAVRSGQAPAAIDLDHAGGYCPNCGDPVNPGDKFCGGCGAKLVG